MANIQAYTLSETIDIIVVLVIVVLIPFAVFVASNVVVPFLDERAYLKMEIKRSTNENEADYYKKRLKILYLQHIPFIGLFIKK